MPQPDVLCLHARFHCVHQSLNLFQLLSASHAAGPSLKRSRCPAKLTVKASAGQKDAAHKAPLDYLRDAAKVSKALSVLIKVDGVS